MSSWLRSGCLHCKERFMCISESKFILEMKQIAGNLQHMQFFCSSIRFMFVFHWCANVILVALKDSNALFE